jgi:hypothetical protein
LRIHYIQVNALTNSRSLTAKIFTREDEGQNHGQVGNRVLALEAMRKWIEKKSRNAILRS